MRESSEAGGEAFARQSWGEAFEQLHEVPHDQLGASGLERLAIAAYLVGRDDEAASAWEEAHRRHLDGGDRAEAARCGFWVGFCLMMQGHMAQAGGWLRRTETVIDDDLACAAAGYLRVPAMLRALDADDAAGARDLAVEAGEIAIRFGDLDLAAFATLGHGQSLLAMGDEPSGLARLDEAMVSVTSGEVGPIASGIVYCAVILECMQLFDLGRAAEWTAALEDWCAAQTGLVPYRGQCLVHRSQLQQAAGDWPEAMATVASARERLTDPPHPALGLACYQEGELCRLRGDVDGASVAYRRASRAGYAPMPGLALLEVGRGEAGAAAATIRGALSEAGQPFQRPALLSAAVEIRIEAGDLDGAGDAAEELATIAVGSSSEALRATADHAMGSVLLTAGETADALARLRSAGAVWQRLRMPYESARTAELLGRGCRELGDESSAELELENARETFASLGAAPDAERVRAAQGERVAPRDDVLSARELEVLAQVADGKTNREIAEVLSISQHTVGRHLENIFAKLGVSGRAAATAYAYQHDLL